MSNYCYDYVDYVRIAITIKNFEIKRKTHGGLLIGNIIINAVFYILKIELCYIDR